MVQGNNYRAFISKAKVGSQYQTYRDKFLNIRGDAYARRYSQRRCCRFPVIVIEDLSTLACRGDKTKDEETCSIMWLTKGGRHV